MRLTASTYYVISPLRVHASSIVKSISKIDLRWAFRKVEHAGVLCQSVAGSMPSAFRYVDHNDISNVVPDVGECSPCLRLRLLFFIFSDIDAPAFKRVLIL